MTNQEKKESLGRYRQADLELDRLCEEMAHWQARADTVTPAFNQGPAGDWSGGLAVERIIALESEINTEIDKALEIKQQVVNAIKTVPDQTLQVLLSRRYILGQTWERIAAAMDYSYKQICRLHGKALLFTEIES